jgi:hypothetical protein
MVNDIYNKSEIEESIKQTNMEIENLLESEDFDDEQYTKLLYQQLIKSLYLQI